MLGIMRRLIIIFAVSVTYGCNQQLELTTENLYGSWAYLDEDSSYTEIHFNDTIYAIHLENVGLQGFYYWIQNDTILRANGEDSRIPIAIVKRLTKEEMTLQRPDQNLELERFNYSTDIAFQRLVTDSLDPANSHSYQERAKEFYKSKGIEWTLIDFEEDDLQDE